MSESLHHLAARPFADLGEHLALELQRLELLLHRQVLRLRAAQAFVDDPFRGLYIPDHQVDALLADAGNDRAPSPGATALGRQLSELDHQRSRRLAASRQAGLTPPLVVLGERFGLCELELDALLLALAPEIDRRYETLYAYVQNDVTRKRATVGLALDLLSDDLSSRLACRTIFEPSGHLLGNRLLRLVGDTQEPEPALPGRCLRLEDRIASFVLGHPAIDQELADFTEVVHTPAATATWLPPVVGEQLARAGRLVADGGGLLVYGRPGAGKRQAAELLAASLGRPLVAADLGLVASPAGSLADRLALLRREVTLLGGVLCLEHLEALLGDGRDTAALLTLARELTSLPLPLVLTGEQPWQPAGLWRQRPFVSLALPEQSIAARRELWRRSLAAAGGSGIKESELAEVAGKLGLTPGQIGDAALRAVHLAFLRGAGPAAVDAGDLHAGARAQSTTGLARLARRVTTSFTWHDLVVPRRTEQQLHEIVASVRHRGTVYGTWGFATRHGQGRGVNVLLAGPSGTGKTMAAALIAADLRLELYRVDLATVVSKYIGETEKNLARIFDEAEQANAVLFFDEADALFGKRSEVKDAHDRYANLEVAYLLQRMEEYQGISILATNLGKSIDQAFARRLAHTIELPLPDAALRRRLWQQVFPASTPLADDVDLDFLARQFELTGGNIRNVALAAAFLAADEGGELQMRHLVQAVARELTKIGKLPTRSEFRQHYESIRR